MKGGIVDYNKSDNHQHSKPRRGNGEIRSPWLISIFPTSMLRPFFPTLCRHASPIVTTNPNPTTTHAISPISEGGETGSRGHLSVQVVCRPGQAQTPPPVACGGPSRHCPIAHGCRAHRLRGFEIMSNHDKFYAPALPLLNLLHVVGETATVGAIDRHRIPGAFQH